MTDFLILGVFILFTIFGLIRPYISFAGYLWVNTMAPQTIVFGFLAGKSLSLYMALVCFISLVLGFRKLSVPHQKAVPFFLVLFAVWITLSTYNAQFPFIAWVVWDTTFKTVLMAFFLLFVIQTRKQLEFMILVLISSLSFYIISAGAKTLTGGGGYGNTLIVGGGNSGMAESSTLATFAVVAMPIIFFLKKHITLITQLQGKNYLWYGALILCLGTVIGTSARTGLVALAAYIAIYFIKPKNILKIIPVLIICAIAFIYFAPDSWKERMGTMENVSEESSAMGRVVVWKWTIDYVATKPIMGGGFWSFIANKGQLNKYTEDFYLSNSKAYHSIYFQLLGEQGYGGFFIYFFMLFLAFMTNRKIMRSTVYDDWSKDLAMHMNHAIIIFCVGGAFISIAYQPLIFTIIALTISHYSILEKSTLEKTKFRSAH
ncbi:putative O-glycosylation ligase, exosortase A system-associated [Brumicola nitratireducens]|uniref:O-antigen polymerase n=1 Tax=Glaciecola nitratireducens (strain JCM 12485 / KCTC 12276 / FR1064) TaxID=1085623 RepID=G4QI39_GLANF|nr:putative O-glycosylation ligase, exosortase A system-associated [Glaciecola nitratireducens]AEP30653.1 O-antigen polymerase [Glaciecola nitratireducens FR1064]